MMFRIFIIGLFALLGVTGLDSLAQKKNNISYGHEWVDLGLPSGKLWASCNIGAFSPSDPGRYIGWSPEIVNQYWNQHWTLPSQEDWKELIENCKWHYEDRQTHALLVVEGPSGRSIFLPASGKNEWLSSSGNIRNIYSVINLDNGMVERENIPYGETVFNYWTSNKDGSEDAYSIYYNVAVDDRQRFLSQPISDKLVVRPVINGKLAFGEDGMTLHTDSSSELNLWPEFINIPDGSSDGHDYVDLGLPSGNKWATVNLGATTPSEGGEYFAWGETQSKKTFYLEDTPVMYERIFYDFGGNRNLDAATVNWGGRWQMPDDFDFQELIDCCNWVWSCDDGREGYIVTGPTGKKIFLPAAGLMAGRKVVNNNKAGFLWSSSTWNYSFGMSLDLLEDNSAALAFSKDKGGYLYMYPEKREYGLNIRPVIPGEAGTGSSSVSGSKAPLEIFPDEIIVRGNDDGYVPEKIVYHADHFKYTKSKNTRNDKNKGKRGFGSFMVETDPPGAIITLDNRFIGRSNLRRNNLRSGTYTLTAELEGYQKRAVIFQLKPDQTKLLQIQLMPIIRESQYTNIVLKVGPKGSSVEIDGEYRGKTPLKLENINKGTHKISITKDGYVPYRGTFFSNADSLSVKGYLEKVSDGAIRFFPNDSTAYIDLGLPSGNLWGIQDYFVQDIWETGKIITAREAFDHITDLDDYIGHTIVDFRIPEIEEWNELHANCTWQQVTFAGQKGHIIRGPNGNTIFLPYFNYLSQGNIEPDGKKWIRWRELIPVERDSKTNSVDLSTPFHLRGIFGIDGSEEESDSGD